jgi:hypothetical protein
MAFTTCFIVDRLYPRSLVQVGQISRQIFPFGFRQRLFPPHLQLFDRTNVAFNRLSGLPFP